MNVEAVGPAVALIVVLGLDTIACTKPIASIKNDLERLGSTPAQIKIIPVAKYVPAAGFVGFFALVLVISNLPAI